MNTYATIDDVIILFRPLTNEERARAEALLPIIEDSLRMEAVKRGKDLDQMVDDNPALASVIKSVEVDVVGRTLNTSTSSEPMTQMTQSALGYSVSGSYLVPGGGLFIKKSELARIGLKRQTVKAIELC